MHMTGASLQGLAEALVPEARVTQQAKSTPQNLKSGCLRLPVPAANQGSLAHQGRARRGTGQPPPRKECPWAPGRGRGPGDPRPLPATNPFSLLPCKAETSLHRRTEEDAPEWEEHSFPSDIQRKGRVEFRTDGGVPSGRIFLAT